MLPNIGGLSQTAEIKIHTLLIVCVNSIQDSPILITGEWIDYPHALLWDFAHDKVASVWVRNYPACNNHVSYA